MKNESAKHTQGWKVDLSRSYLIRDAKKWNMVAVIDGYGGNLNPSDAMRENALLIDSLPDLLEALESIMQDCDGRNSSHIGQARAFSTARSAIAKATGADQ